MFDINNYILFIYLKLQIHPLSYKTVYLPLDTSAVSASMNANVTEQCRAYIPFDDVSTYKPKAHTLLIVRVCYI